MNAEKFVEVIRNVVVNGSEKSVKLNLEQPPGREPLLQLVVMSEWYNQLNENDKVVVAQIIQESVNTAIFSFLCVLDGVKAIENENKGELKLFYENQDIKLLLNDSEEEYLHDLFNVSR